ncbi:hydroxyethylthiazole kinase [Pseudoclavibacter chungangensis]|uniref:Hydroxyethylthiazole kinase n=1 Tax=Pseudoclavibacter chungangensis TaxID=587635 RepID=A0A7J5C068_9MICO|nr:hydroxyethylthiazole kinase [Pseudoclavibacter chungangensis]KAB1660270.1 hydroxyethylthiazole kinase [Pseudoclavibacter chungangensis]NYJ65616.1 hydroxyethylthiazole kinase [Pseudoclavibacter chungangensis]
MTRTPSAVLTSAAELLGEVRRTTPLVQCVTNVVTVNFVANTLLAIGASPAMADVPGEAELFARDIASASLVNLGTPSGEQRLGMLETAAGATAGGTPWVFDPVAVGALPVRTALAAELLAARPTIIRGNASEISALAGATATGRGVDSQQDVDDALDAARTLANATGGAVAVSGPVDLVTDGESVVRIANGDPLLTRVTGGGCALGGVVAAFAAVAERPIDAAVAACTAYAVAAEFAAAVANGPGSFAVAFLDALDALTADDIVRAGRVS